MRTNLKRLNKRQFKKLIKNRYDRDYDKYRHIFNHSMNQIFILRNMFDNGKDAKSIIQKTEEVIRGGLRITDFSYEKFVLEYQKTGFYNNSPYSSYLDISTLDTSMDELRDAVDYIKRYGWDYFESRFFRLFHWLQLCKYFIGQEAQVPLKFTSEIELVENLKTMIYKDFTTAEVNNIYNNEVLNKSFEDFKKAKLGYLYKEVEIEGIEEKSHYKMLGELQQVIRNCKRMARLCESFRKEDVIESLFKLREYDNVTNKKLSNIILI